MKESKLYLNFIRKYFWWYFVAFFIGSALSLVYSLNSPTLYSADQFFEIDYQQNNISDRVVLVDHIIEVLRSANLQKELRIKGLVSIYKKSSLLIDTKVTNGSMELSKKDTESL